MINLNNQHVSVYKTAPALASLAALIISNRPCRRRVSLLVVLMSLVFLGGCATSSRYQLDKDMGPSGEVDLSHIAEPVPVATQPGRRGNKSPYKVFGKSYHVMASGKGYIEEGIASWYGKKFHGYKTSNGEIYDMYRYSAAHKSLPLPIYARVTNLANGRQVLVRVNDRGPFHGNRLIDLSYAAAKKLDYLASGTARVRVEAYPFTGSASTRSQSRHVERTANTYQSEKSAGESSLASEAYFLQVGAFGDRQSAKSTVEHLTSLAYGPVFLQQVGSQELYRVRIGPISQFQQAAEIQRLLKEAKYPDTFLVNNH